MMFTIDILLLARKLFYFFNSDCEQVHRNLYWPSIFVDAAGEWKLSNVKFVGQFSEYSLPTNATL